MRDWYDMCIRGEWEEALKIQRKVNKLSHEAISPLLKVGYVDPTIDKATIEISGFLKGNRRTRKPYLPLPDKEANKLRKILQEKYSEFLWNA